MPISFLQALIQIAENDSAEFRLTADFLLQSQTDCSEQLHTSQSSSVLCPEPGFDTLYSVPLICDDLPERLRAVCGIWPEDVLPVSYLLLLKSISSCYSGVCMTRMQFTVLRIAGSAASI